MWKQVCLSAMTAIFTMSMPISGYTQDEMVNGVRTINNAINNVVYAEPIEKAVVDIGIAPDGTQQVEEKVEIKHDYSSIEISDEEYVELCQIVAAEAQTQSLDGQKAVVEVIFNRVLSPEWPNTVHDVLSQKGQFATWRMRNAKWVEPDIVVEAIASVVTNGRQVLPDTEYVYFDRKGVNGRKKIRIQDHVFGK